jgi:hypothetical protein
MLMVFADLPFVYLGKTEVKRTAAFGDGGGGSTNYKPEIKELTSSQLQSLFL